MGWGMLGVAEEVLGPISSLSCDWSVGWLELSWHLMAWQKSEGLGKNEADAQLRKRKRKGRLQSRMVNRWKALRCF